MKKAHINIGEYLASDTPLIIHTILGSCVAVCLYDLKNQIGGMNHILLPGKPSLKEYDPSARYGINAMELLINRIMSIGGDRRHLKAKVFGGANVISAITEEYSMGKKNSEFAIDFLNDEKIKIANMDIGGKKARKIFFHTDTGDVFLKYIPPVLQTYISKKEADRLKRIKREIDRVGKVTLFDD